VYNKQYTTFDCSPDTRATTTPHEPSHRTDSTSLLTHSRARLLVDGVYHVVHLVVFFQVLGDARAHRDDPHSGLAGLGQCATDQNAAQPATPEVVTDLGVMEDALLAPVDVGGEAGRLAVDCDLVPIVLRRATDGDLGCVLGHEAPFGLSGFRLSRRRVATVRTVPGR